MNARRVLAFIFCTVSLDILALGLMIPVLPKLVLAFMGDDTAAAAKVFGLFATVWGLMQFIFSPLLGSLSDRYGRRPVILLSCLGLGLDYVFMAIAPSLTLLFVGRVVSGITAATISTASAYIADVTLPKERARAFGLIGMAFGLGFVLGPAAGGLLGAVDLRLPFWVSAAACLLNAGFGWLVLPESLPRERRTAFSWKRANPIGALRLLARHGELLGLAFSNFLAQVAHQVLPSVFVLYAAYRYGWGDMEVGLTLAFVGICAAGVQGLLVGPLVARLGERRALLLGLASGALGMVVYGVAPTGGWFCLGVPVMALWGLPNPAAQGPMTRLVNDSEQGQLQGAGTSMNSIAGLLAPGLFTVTFAHFIGRTPGHLDVPGSAFLLAALVLLAAMAAAWFATRPRPSAGRLA
jgi:DHA1 family tetracycline resistance protein-like MFS transporter